MKTTKLVPVDYINIIEQNQDLIKSIISSNKEGKSKASQKQLAYSETKLIHLVAYLYERDNNLYASKKTYNGIPVSILKQIIGFSSDKQTQLHLNILIGLQLITKTGKAVAGKRSFDYEVKKLDIFNFEGYKQKDQFVKYTFEIKKVKDVDYGNEALNNALLRSVSINFNTQEYADLKANLITINPDIENHMNYVELNFKNKVYGFEQSNKNDRRISLFSVCKKEIRNMIKIDGEEVVKFDFANSQPAILASYIKHQLNKYNIELSDDIKLFIDLASKGFIYDYIGNKLFNGNRDEAKNLWMAAGYGEMSIRVVGDEVMQVNKKGLLLAELFPNVIKFLDNKKYGEKSTAYKQVSITLQRLEAKLVNPISDLLFANGIINITVYDEFIIKKSQADEAYEIIKSYVAEQGLDIILKKDKVTAPEVIKTTENDIVATYKMYDEKIATKFPNFYNQKIFRVNKIFILNELVKHQPRNSNDIKQIIEQTIKINQLKS